MKFVSVVAVPVVVEVIAMARLGIVRFRCPCGGLPVRVPRGGV
ncbi:hypothetical protein [Streptomyces sp. NPDC001927]